MIFQFKLYLLIKIKRVPVLNAVIIRLLSISRKLMMAPSDFFNTDLHMRLPIELEKESTKDGIG